MFNKIQPQKAYVYILQQILDLVQNGKLKAGDKLPPESILTQNFGASRPTIRQALSALEVLGVIETKGGKGSYVQNHLNFDYLRYQSTELERATSPAELLESRKLLEACIAELAAVKSTPEDIALLEKNFHKYKDSIEKSSGKIDHDKLFQLDMEFHLLLVKSTHNRALIQMMRYTVRGLKGQVWIKLKEKSLGIPGRLNRCLEEHHDILEAVRRRHHQEAREKMFQHISGIEMNFFG